MNRWFHHKVDAVSHGLTGQPSAPVDVQEYTPVGTWALTSLGRFERNGSMQFRYAKVSRNCARWLVDSGLSHRITKGSTSFTTTKLSLGKTHKIDILTAHLRTNYSVFRSAQAAV